MTSTELLAPAKDLECGMAAIDCGADAVYIGPARFGAREAAGNTIDDIAALAEHAHKFWARVYATVNTLLRDDEISKALSLIRKLYEAGVDGLIIQDAGLLECDLPPLPLIASTQMHNASPERVAFLEKVGFRRVILARELSLEQIRAIRAAAPTIELECFVHGALCVCYSGQCQLSYALGGRSGNRGACAQPCRKSYDLVDGTGATLARDRHLLSLRDLNLSESYPGLLAAGVTAFKIEGRLKDAGYVANVVAHHRARLDAALAETSLKKGSSGAAAVDFTPDPAKTFNRGYTTYFLGGPGPAAQPVGSPDTPKMLGEPLGRVTAIHGAASITLDTAATLHAGDGICFFGRDGKLRGSTVNAARGRILDLLKTDGLENGTLVYRNHDHDFLTKLKKARKERRIAIRLALRPAPGGMILTATDENNVTAEYLHPCAPEPAAKPEQALENLRRQLAKTGGTDFHCAEVTLDFGEGPVPFLPVGEINALRRGGLEALAAARKQWRPRLVGAVARNDEPYPERELTYLGNVLNRRAEAFYRRHGVTSIEPAAESGLDMRGRKVMTTRYCIKHQLGMCARDKSATRPAEPLTLIDEDGNRLTLRFRCDRCEMDVYLDA